MNITKKAPEGRSETPQSRRLFTVVAGARPNFMKVAPVIAALQGRVEIRFVHTGQHYSHQLSDALISELGLPAPDTNLGVGSGTHATQTAAVMRAFEKDLTVYRPDVVVVAGDVNSTLACALVSAQAQIPVAHIEAGLRSGDWEMPEELNRVLTDRLSKWLFTTSSDANANLEREGIEGGRVHLVGNTMIDSLLKSLPRARLAAAARVRGLNLGSEFGIVTLHRGSNVDEPRVLAAILHEVGRLSEHLKCLLPLHPRTAKIIRSSGVAVPSSITVCDALTYFEFIGLIEKASLVLTDSGGVQEETTALGVPCLTLRTTTERPITCELGTNHLIGTDPSVILPASIEALKMPRRPIRIPLWDGCTASRIASVLAASF